MVARRVCDCGLLFRPRECYIKQPSLILIISSGGAGDIYERKKIWSAFVAPMTIVGQDYIHVIKFLALGAMGGHKTDSACRNGYRSFEQYVMRSQSIYVCQKLGKFKVFVSFNQRLEFVKKTVEFAQFFKHIGLFHDCRQKPRLAHNFFDQ